MIGARAVKDRNLVVALCGGIGGAKLALGLSHAVDDEDLIVAVNTGDDFEHFGLHVSPDIDTVVYTLAGVANPETGWGRAEESWNFMEAMAALGGETWFSIGDKDLAMHVKRSGRLKAGESLTAVTDEARRRLAVRARIVPMSNDPVRTMVDTEEGLLNFQNYFVQRRCEPKLKSVRYDGADTARLQEGLARALASPQLRAVIMCPSNPYLSLGPMLALPAMKDALRKSSAPVIAVSPLVGGRAVKGPTAKIMTELGIDISALSIARHYQGLIDGFVLDRQDAVATGAVGVPVAVEQTVMTTLNDRIALAHACLAFADRLAGAGALHKEQVA